METGFPLVSSVNALSTYGVSFPPSASPMGALSSPPAYATFLLASTMNMCGVLFAPYAFPTLPSSSRSTAWFMPYSAAFTTFFSLPAPCLPAAPLLMAEFPGVTKETIGDIASAGVFAYAAGKLVNGVATEYLGGRRLFLSGLFLSVGCTLLLLPTAAYLPFIVPMMVVWVVNRFVQSMGWGGLVQIVGRWFPAGRIATVMGVLSMSYLVGDAARVDPDGYLWVIGRIDDVVNVSGHRLSTAEVESAIVAHESVAEAAVIGQSDPDTGQAICAFVTLNDGVPHTDELIEAIRGEVATRIGKFARPRRIVWADDLPKTRSGKIMRRLLRDIAEGRALGDVTTLRDPGVMAALEDQIAAEADDE